jgi:hypothetical protein
MRALRERIATPRESLIYRLQSDEILEAVDHDVQWKAMARDEIRTFFPDSFVVRQFFAEGFAKRHICVLLYSGTEWISYGWIRPPNTPAPRHLPHWIGKTKDYWAYYACTKQKYRRMGFNKYVKKLRIDLIHDHAKSRDVNIYMDTMVENIAARQSMLSTGFVPDGIMRCYYIKCLKYLNYMIFRNPWGYVWGDWNRGREHPQLSIDRRRAPDGNVQEQNE